MAEECPRDECDKLLNMNVPTNSVITYKCPEHGDVTDEVRAGG
jgi:hypothetical protein